MTQKQENILMYAFRYAIGRNTYAVADVVEEILENKEKLSNHFKESVLVEIEQSDIMYEPYSIKWNELINELKNEK
jgi:hypothetical protein